MLIDGSIHDGYGEPSYCWVKISQAFRVIVSCWFPRVNFGRILLCSLVGPYEEGYTVFKSPQRGDFSQL